MTISGKQAKALKVRPSSPWSPIMEKCGLRTCAQVSYDQAEAQIHMLTGIRMGHSSLNRLVNRTSIPLAESEIASSYASIDGGKIRLRVENIENLENNDEAEKKSSWKDYKAAALSNGIGEAFFQDNDALQTWSTEQPLNPQFIVLGDGHDGVWNIARTFGGEQVQERIEVLDWFHLMENLCKVKMSGSERNTLRHHLWHGEVEKVLPILKGMRTYEATRFRRYLEKHRHRLPNYEDYKANGLCIGSGDVESLVKQIGERVKITGARWKPKNAPQILRLRTAYLNDSPILSICA